MSTIRESLFFFCFALFFFTSQAAPQFVNQNGQQLPPGGQFQRQPEVNVQPGFQNFFRQQNPGPQAAPDDASQDHPRFNPSTGAESTDQEAPALGPSPQSGPPAPPKIDWGQCPQLKPNEKEMGDKANIIRTCLQENPLPEKITQDTVEKHRTDVAKCALNKENWFDNNNNYRFEKAESEIKAKGLDPKLQNQILAEHSQCRQEAMEQFGDAIISQVQLYQACMDYHISQICGIKITPPQMTPVLQ